MPKMSADDLIDRFVGQQMTMQELAESQKPALTAGLLITWGDFTPELAEETGYPAWDEIAGVIVDHARAWMQQGAVGYE